MAGKPILPGCTPQSCLAQHKVSVQYGSVHAQALPFAMDAWNVTGSYQTMVQSCVDADGSMRCFKKGYADETLRMLPVAQAEYQTLMQVR